MKVERWKTNKPENKKYIKQITKEKCFSIWLTRGGWDRVQHDLPASNVDSFLTNGKNGKTSPVVVDEENVWVRANYKRVRENHFPNRFYFIPRDMAILFALLSFCYVIVIASTEKEPVFKRKTNPIVSDVWKYLQFSPYYYHFHSIATRILYLFLLPSISK